MSVPHLHWFIVYLRLRILRAHAMLPCCNNMQSFAEHVIESIKRLNPAAKVDKRIPEDDTDGELLLMENCHDVSRDDVMSISGVEHVRTGYGVGQLLVGVRKAPPILLAQAQPPAMQSILTGEHRTDKSPSRASAYTKAALLVATWMLSAFMVYTSCRERIPSAGSGLNTISTICRQLI